MVKRWLEHIPLEDLVTELSFRGFAISQEMPKGLTKSQIKNIDALDQLKTDVMMAN